MWIGVVTQAPLPLLSREFEGLNTPGVRRLQTHHGLNRYACAQLNGRTMGKLVLDQECWVPGVGARGKENHGRQTSLRAATPELLQGEESRDWLRTNPAP